MNIGASKKKILKCLLGILIFSFFVLIFGLYFLTKSKVPQMSGTLSIVGLKSNVKVERDHFGVPHIYADNNHDAFVALGYILASERLFQMDISRLLARGELSEMVGEKALESDLLYRNLGLRHHSEEWLKRNLDDQKFNPEMLAEAEAFYSGVNQFIKNGPTPIEYLILGTKPKDFSLVDGMSFLGLMSFSFGNAPTMDTLLSKLVKRIGDNYVQDMRIEKIPNAKNHFVLNNLIDFDLDKKISNVITFLEQGFTLFEGSNGWVLSGERTQSGHPILANDPHINFSHPGVWFEAHLKTPSYEQYGHFLPLIPFPIHAYNRQRGWGVTMSLTDDMDIYREKVNLKNKTYTFSGKELPLSERSEIIKVKNRPDVNILVHGTHHGPIVNSVLKNREVSEDLSLQWSFYALDNDPITATFFMGRAKNMSEFKSAVALGKAPGLNIIYADTKNIGWWLFGEVWKKRVGLRTDLILDGTSGKDEILSYMNFAEKPHLENPTNGIIVSANSRPEHYPETMRGDWQANDRYKTLESIFAAKNTWSPDELREVQALSMNFENKKILDLLLSELQNLNQSDLKQYQEYILILKNWDLKSGIEAVGPTLYYSWCYQILSNILVDLKPEEKEMTLKSPNGWIFFKRIIFDKNSVWWNKFNRHDIIRDSFKESISKLALEFGNQSSKWNWGKIHTIEFVHPIGRVPPLNKIFNLGPYPAPGANHEVNNFKFSGLLDGFKVKAGPSMRKIIDFKTPEKSLGILPAGNSGHLMSPFYKNQIELFLSGDYRPMLLDLSPSDIKFSLQLIP